MRIYVACLASYNSGILHGAHIDASTDIEEMQAEISAMLRRSPCPNVTVPDYVASAEKAGWTRVEHNGHWCGPLGSDTRTYIGTAQELCEDEELPLVMVPSAEEWAIHDSEGLGDLGEYAGLDEVARRVAVAELADERDIPASVLLDYARDHMSGEWDVDDLESEIDDHYRGQAESWKDFAQEWTEDVHDMSEVPAWLQGHIDWESIGRDFELGGDFTAYEHDFTLYIFYAA